MSFLPGPTPLAIAHRGGAGWAPENSLEAFERCVDLGFRYVETDVHLTADGVVVAFHDRHLDRVTDRTGPIAARTWAEVSAARIGGTGRIPRLEDLLRTWPDLRVNIDAKVPDVVVPLALLLRRERALDRVCLSSFSDSRLARLRSMLPGVTTALGPREVTVLRMASYSPRGSALLRFRGRAAQVPPSVRGRAVVDERFVATAHRLGVDVHVWTVDDPGEMRRLLSLGVDGIMTDQPRVLRDVLVAEGQWR